MPVRLDRPETAMKWISIFAGFTRQAAMDELRSTLTA